MFVPGTPLFTSGCAGDRLWVTRHRSLIQGQRVQIPKHLLLLLLPLVESHCYSDVNARLILVRWPIVMLHVLCICFAWTTPSVLRAAARIRADRPAPSTFFPSKLLKQSIHSPRVLFETLDQEPRGRPLQSARYDMCFTS